MSARFLSIRHRYPPQNVFSTVPTESMNIHDRKEKLTVPLVLFNLAPNPSHFLFFILQQAHVCILQARGLSEREGATRRSAPFPFMKEDRALAAVALSAPASPAINPPLSCACARRSGRCVGARSGFYAFYSRTAARVLTHTRV